MFVVANLVSWKIGDATISPARLRKTAETERVAFVVLDSSRTAEPLRLSRITTVSSPVPAAASTCNAELNDGSALGLS